MTLTARAPRSRSTGDARRKHLCVCGATGAGKSHLITSVAAADIAAGHGVTVIDPHGEPVAGLLANHIPKARSEDVIVLDAKDQARALSINILDAPRPEEKALVVSNAMNIFETLWRDSIDPRMLDILRNALFVLIEQPFPTSFAALPTFLTDSGFRSRMLAQFRDPIILDFFHNTYDRWVELVSGGSDQSGAQQSACVSYESPRPRDRGESTIEPQLPTGS